MCVLPLRSGIAVLLLLFAQSPSAFSAEVGEFGIRAVNPLSPPQLDQLRELVRQDPEAAAIAKTVAEEAMPLLDAQVHPLVVIHYEGLVNTNPERIATVDKLREMDSVALLTRYWQASGDPRAAKTLRRFIMAWVSTYRPTGNDVNENKLYPLFVASSHLRQTFSWEDRQKIDAWLRRLGELHEPALAKSKYLTNRYTKHARILALLGRILDQSTWQNTAESAIKRFVSHSLRADGSSLDLEVRDTLPPCRAPCCATPSKNSPPKERARWRSLRPNEEE